MARQLVLAGVPLPALRHVFITHHHSDHNADYGNLIWLAWTAGLRTTVDTWGPPPLERMTKLFFEMNASDIDARISNEGRVPLAPLVRVHEIRDGGAVVADERVKVTAALVDHPPMVPAFAYRFDGSDRSIVISGDTAPSDNLATLARGADVLVHSAMYPAAIDRLVARVPNAAALKASILAHQTSAEDAGRLAQTAGVKTLVLSHLVPPDDPEVTRAHVDRRRAPSLPRSGDSRAGPARDLTPPGRPSNRPATARRQPAGLTTGERAGTQWFYPRLRRSPRSGRGG